MHSCFKSTTVLCAAVFLALLAGIAPADAQLNCVGTAGSTNISINNCTIPPANLGVTGNVAIGSSFVTATPPANGMIIQGALGVGTTAPSNLLDVSGGVAIGTQYVGVTTAPASGLLVQGNVGIGTTVPVSALSVFNGGLAVGSYAATTAANSGNAIFSGNVGIGTATPINKFELYSSTAGTSVLGVLGRFHSMSTGTPAAGFGVLNQFLLDNSANVQTLAADYGALWINATSGSEKGAFIIRTSNTGGVTAKDSELIT